MSSPAEDDMTGEQDEDYPMGEEDDVDPFDFDARPATPEREGPSQNSAIAALLHRRSLVELGEGSSESPGVRPPLGGSAGRSRRKSSAARSLRGRNSVVAVDDGELEPFDFDASPPPEGARRVSEAPDEGMLTRLLSRRRTLSDSNLRPIPLPRALSHSPSGGSEQDGDEESPMQQFTSAADLIHAALSLGSGQYASIRSPPDPRLPSFRPSASPTSAPRIDDVLADLTPTNSDDDEGLVNGQSQHLAAEPSFVITAGRAASQFGFTLSPTDDFTEAVRRARMLGIEAGERKARDTLELNENVVFVRLSLEQQEDDERIALFLDNRQHFRSAPQCQPLGAVPVAAMETEPVEFEEENCRRELLQPYDDGLSSIHQQWWLIRSHAVDEEEGRARASIAEEESDGRRDAATSHQLRVHRFKAVLVDEAEVQQRAQTVDEESRHWCAISRQAEEVLEQQARECLITAERWSFEALCLGVSAIRIVGEETAARTSAWDLVTTTLCGVVEQFIAQREAIESRVAVEVCEAAERAQLIEECSSQLPRDSQAAWVAQRAAMDQEDASRVGLQAEEYEARHCLHLARRREQVVTEQHASFFADEARRRAAVFHAAVDALQAANKAGECVAEVLQLSRAMLGEHRELADGLRSEWRGLLAQWSAAAARVEKVQRQIDRLIEAEVKARRLLRSAEKASWRVLVDERDKQKNRRPESAVTVTSTPAEAVAKQRLAELRAVDHWKKTFTALTEVDRAFAEEKTKYVEEPPQNALRPPMPVGSSNPLVEIRSPVAPLDRPKARGFVRRIVLGSERERQQTDGPTEVRTGRPKAMSISQSLRPASREVTPLARQRFSVSLNPTSSSPTHPTYEQISGDRAGAPPRPTKQQPRQNGWVELNPAPPPPQSDRAVPPNPRNELQVVALPDAPPPLLAEVERHGVEPEPISVHVRAAGSAARTAKRKALEMVRKKFAGYF